MSQARSTLSAHFSWQLADSFCLSTKPGLIVATTVISAHFSFDLVAIIT